MYVTFCRFEFVLLLLQQLKFCRSKTVFNYLPCIEMHDLVTLQQLNHTA